MMVVSHFFMSQKILGQFEQDFGQTPISLPLSLNGNSINYNETFSVLKAGVTILSLMHFSLPFIIAIVKSSASDGHRRALSRLCLHHQHCQCLPSLLFVVVVQLHIQFFFIHHTYAAIISPLFRRKSRRRCEK
jgi:hypothetical protein